MSKKVAVDVDRLRTGAASLADAGAVPAASVLQLGDAGSPRADAVHTQFEMYWSSGRSAVVDSVDALTAVLRSAADAYVSRDSESAAAFGSGSRAF
ncbi:hypothetical protein AB4Z18_10530 [Leifsonia sp. 2TAF2]|uniref:hypothetical protein n=1 Tax=Leifsonia sp. 2TAF2 TaxID=3233009 RepID=UPI003F9E83F6